jgi:hypothetical protein
MLHPLMTAELVRQRRAALAAESRNQRLVRPLRRARADPRARPAMTERTLACHDFQLAPGPSTLPTAASHSRGARYGAGP